MEIKKVRWTKTYAINGLRMIDMVYVRFASGGDGWVERYNLIDDGVLVRSLTSNLATEKILENFLEGVE